MPTRRRRSAQLFLATRGTGRGGWRAGAGRKPKPEHERRGHVARPQSSPRAPVHVTLRIVPGVPSLRRARTLRVLRECFIAGKDRFGFRLNHFSVQSNHLHLQGLTIRIARRLNALFGRSGRLFDGRYHLRVLRTPTEVRRALVYVLGNGRKHLRTSDPDWVDDASSAVWFPGWRVPVRDMRLETEIPPVLPPRSWLLRQGWRKAGGLLDPAEAPRMARSAP
jgi:hypothetical protein